MPVAPSARNDHPDTPHSTHQLRYLNKDGSKSIKVSRTSDGPVFSTPLSPKDVNHPAMAATDYPRTQPSLGNQPAPPAGPAGSRKKKKKKGKKASMDATAQQQNHVHHNAHEYGHDHYAHQPYAQFSSRLDYSNPHFDSPELVDADEGVDDYFSDEQAPYEDFYPPNNVAHQNHTGPAPQPAAAKKKKNKKKKKGARNGDTASQDVVVGSVPRNNHIPHHPGGVVAKSKDRIWNTSTNEERERIKEFWLSLGEEERRSLVKVEKEAVLRKMKEQQKHSCSCSVCGRKRTAIEEELEVLYDAYYEELEQYANQQQGKFIPSISNGDAHSHYPPRQAQQNRLPSSAPPHLQRNVPPGAIQHHIDDVDDEDYDDDDEDEDYDDDEDDVDEGVADDPRPDFFNFGNSLTVKGGILTVADDLLKNDGKKFIEMMEQLAERRMQREEEATSMSNAHYGNTMIPPGQMHHGHPPQGPQYDDDEDDEEEYDEDEEDYDDEEEDENDQMTEEQRMEEGRRMFQIFAARMFEQRVLTAYREKVAQERQRKLLEELEEENRLKEEREQKKIKEKEKKKDRKRQQKLAREEEKQRKEAEKAAEEAAQRAIEEKKAEEARKRKEEQRLKREAEKRAQEEERQRKEEEKRKRIAEEKEREAEKERKRKEYQERERKKKEEEQRKLKEEKEAREREAKAKREKEEKERREKEVKAKKEAEERERLRREEEQRQRAEAQKSSQNSALHSQPAAAQTLISPRPAIATPALPKSNLQPSPARQHPSSAASPKTPQVAPRVNTAMSPNNAQQVSPNPLKQTAPLFTPQHLPPGLTAPPMGSPLVSSIGAPPGVPLPSHHPFSNLDGMPMNGGPMAGSPFMSQRSLSNRIPMYSPAQMPIGNGFGAFGPAVTPLQTPPPPPGMPIPPQNRPMFPPGVIPQTPIQPIASIGSPFMRPAHTMQTSTAPIGTRPHGSMDGGSTPRAVPAPIARPQSVAPKNDLNGEDAVHNAHLGSSALTADDEIIGTENFPLGRRGSATTRPRMNPFGSGLGSGFLGSDPLMDMFNSPAPRPNWTNPAPFAASLPNSWGTTSGAGWNDMDASRSTFNFNSTNRGVERLSTLRKMAVQILGEHTNSTNASSPPGSEFMSAAEFSAALRDRSSELGEITDSEIDVIFDMEGNASNGGGRLERSPAEGPEAKDKRQVRWLPELSNFVATQGPPPGLGDVFNNVQGSPGLKSGQGPFGGFGVRVGMRG